MYEEIEKTVERIKDCKTLEDAKIVLGNYLYKANLYLRNWKQKA